MTREALRPEPQNRPQTVLVLAMRNEGSFILECVAYHRVIGINRIVICSNGSTDGSDELLAALADAGLITFLRTTPGRGVAPQQAAVRAFESEVGNGDVHVGDKTIHALVTALGPASAIMLNGRFFGSDGNDNFPGRLLAEAFTGASKLDFAPNLVTRPLFQLGPRFAAFSTNAVGLPKLVAEAKVAAADCVSGNGRPLDARSHRTLPWLEGQSFKGRNNLASRRKAGWGLAQINHYSVRSADHFRLKASRGRGTVSTGPRRGNLRHTRAYFDRFDRNETEDRSILFWESAVTAEIARLMAIPAVAEAKAGSDHMVDKALRDLQNEVTDTSRIFAAPAMQRVIRGMEAEMEKEAEASSFELTFAPKERRFVVRHYEQAETILEYGSGGSTVLAAQLGRNVISVESDRAWADRLSAHLATISDRAQVHYADVGVTGAWGVPMKPREFRKFHAYALSVWDRPDFQEPDLVLIDGRFRASCLIAVMLRAKRPTTVLFDDYRKRGYYHGVEQLAQKEELVGRMARFTVTPGQIPPEMVTQAIGWFSDPR